MRFRIIELLAVITVVCFVVTSLKAADSWHESLFFSFTVATILFSFAMAVGRSGLSRKFWSVFAATSLIYLVFAHHPDIPQTEEEIYDGLVTLRCDGPEITTQVLRYAYKESRDCRIDNIFSDDPFVGAEGGGVFSIVQDEDPLQNTSGDPFQSGDSSSHVGVDLFDGDPFGATDDQAEQDFEPLIDLIRSTKAPAAASQPFPPSLSFIVQGPSRGYDDFEFSIFMRIGHCGWALLLGWIGGHFCLFVARKNSREH